MTHIISVKEIIKTYDGVNVLDKISFKLEKGKSIAIMGRSGSGKSTLLNLLAGLDLPTSGHILFEGQDITLMSETALAQLRGNNIGFVFQSFRLIESLNAIENICLPLELLNKSHISQKAMVWLERLGLKNKAHLFPSALSGGEQQRVALARALVHEPRLLIADEPTGNLDHKTSDEVGDLILQYCKKYNTALIIATHDQNIASRADQTFELYQGALRKVT